MRLDCSARRSDCEETKQDPVGGGAGAGGARGARMKSLPEDMQPKQDSACVLQPTVAVQLGNVVESGDSE